MTNTPGRGFARRVTQETLKKFAPLLRDINAPSGAGGADTAELDPGVDEARGLFQGARLQVTLPFTFPTTPSQVGVGRSSQAGTVSPPTIPVLVTEIGGPGRWSQAAFTYQIFQNFFGGTTVNLTRINADGSRTFEPGVSPIIKGSSNYCYELRAAHGLHYPQNGRPIAVFVKRSSADFDYRLLLPEDDAYEVLRLFLDERWAGPVSRLRRVNVDLATLQTAWQDAPF